MSDPVSLVSLFEAAEQAAGRGDFAAASRLLADAARLQQATLGPDHLDLANTLNNLAVAHERSGQLDDAEREYRRAHAIAARSLPADDPLVTTSAQNLREFCAASGRPVEPSALRLAEAEDAGAATTVVLPRPPQADVPTAPIEPLAITFATGPAVPPPPAAPEPTPVPRPAAPPARAAEPTLAPAAEPTPARADAPVPARAAAPVQPRVAVAPRSRLPVPVLVALGAVAALVIWLFAGRGPAAPPARPEAAAPAASPSAAVPSPPAVPPSAAPATTTPAPAAASAAASPTAADGLTVGDAQLCTSLSPSYQCEAAGASVRAGRLTFYTRLVASQDTSVVHRWYRGNELRQAVRLQVPARRQGFRTYSRGTVSPTAGEWRVELRSRDGRLLHTERFTVR